MINLCDTDNLTEDQKSLLSKGGKFTTVPKHNAKELSKDVHTFCKNLRWKEFFHDDDSDTSMNSTGLADNDPSLVRNKSTAIPPTGRNKALDSYVNFLSSFPKGPTEKHIHFNTSKGEHEALSQLQNDRTIIIKEADKGGAMVIMPNDYITKILTSSSSYAPTTQKAEDSALRKVKLLVTKHKDDLYKDEMDYLTNFESKTSNIYGLPKIHKSKSIIKAISEQKNTCVWTPRPEDLTFRPIIAGPACPTHRLSNLLDILLQPLLVHVPSHIKDTIDFLNKLPSTVQTDTYLVTYDVVNLYGSIPHQLGLEAINYWLHKHPDSVNTRFPHPFISNGLRLILENNVFKFGQDYYIQTKGTAMGTKVGPVYASLVMGYLETQLYSKIREEKGMILADKIVKQWKRFLDDCFITWDPADGSMDYLTETLNGLHPDIQFTVSGDSHQIPFLDVMVIKEGGKIITDIYTKPTDTKNYLLLSSCHPRHVKTGIPITLATRLVTIVSEPTLLEKRLQQLEMDLLNRGYPKSLITNGITKARSKCRQSLLNPSGRGEAREGILPIVTTHNPHNFNFHRLVTNTIDSLRSDTRLRPLVPKLTLINSKRQSANLKAMLTKAKYVDNASSIATMQYQVSKCKDPRCGMCSLMLEGSQYTLEGSGTILKPNNDIDCRALYVIYVIRCMGCHCDYIGSTKHLRHRVALHKSQIKCVQNRNCPVSEHIATCGRGRFKIFPFLKIKSASNSELRQTEIRLIHKHKPKLNSM